MWKPIALALTLASAALAEQVGEAVVHDLNGDGQAEAFWLDHRGDGIADLIITDPDGWAIEVNDLAWIGGFGQRPELGLTDGGSITVMSMNEGIGRNRWRLTLTIAWREGRYVVAGYTYRHYDTLDLSAGGVCDFNLLTGKGVVERVDQVAESVAAPDWPLDLEHWSEAVEVPEVCYSN